MADLPKAYDPSAVEQKWYRFWLEQRYFHGDAATPKAPFSIVIPPPNVTGALHMGHALFVTIQDILIRWRRMGAYNAMWLPGTDHAGHRHPDGGRAHAAGAPRTRAAPRPRPRRVPEARLGSGRSSTATASSSSCKVMGASLDWERERFTMDDGLSRAVREAFVRLHEEGLIYRAERLINWCSRCYTALSDLEVEHEDGHEGHLWHIAYPVAGHQPRSSSSRPRGPRPCSATPPSRCTPRTSAISNLIGKKVELPLTDREHPDHRRRRSSSIAEFGTGAVKVTPGARLQRLRDRPAPQAAERLDPRPARQGQRPRRRRSTAA